jgi:hypothetical protein
MDQKETVFGAVEQISLSLISLGKQPGVSEYTYIVTSNQNHRDVCEILMARERLVESAYAQC